MNSRKQTLCLRKNQVSLKKYSKEKKEISSEEKFLKDLYAAKIKDLDI